MDRIEFVRGLIGAAVVVASPSPAAKAPPVRHIGDCDANPVLPYDRPIGIAMRVLDGPDFHLEKYRGYAVWMNVFATWCGPCNEEQGSVEQIAASYYDRGLRTIGVNFRESDDTVRTYRKKYGLSYPIAMDERGGFTRGLETGRTDENLIFPASLFFSATGYLDCYIQGTMGDSEMRYKVERVLKTVTAPPVPAPVLHRRDRRS
ncbi:MAG TPA: TlpA disulfide reductase family protein [Candidatus Baltobacteraceae bacterium]